MTTIGQSRTLDTVTGMESSVTMQIKQSNCSYQVMVYQERSLIIWQSFTHLRSWNWATMLSRWGYVILVFNNYWKIFFSIYNAILHLMNQSSIPTEISFLQNLTRLRLSYNELMGNDVKLTNLTNLRLIHLHGNRLLGTISTLSWEAQDPWSIISDCGNLSDYSQSLTCLTCTMCCELKFAFMFCCVFLEHSVLTSHCCLFDCLSTR